MREYINSAKQEIDYDDEAGNSYKVLINDEIGYYTEIKSGNACYQELREAANGTLLYAINKNAETGELEGSQMWHSFENRIEANFHKNQLHGLWTMYDDNNNVLKQTYFENGYNIGYYHQCTKIIDNYIFK